MEGYEPWMGTDVVEACEDCPLFAAQAEMTIARDFDGEYRHDTKLTTWDSMSLVKVMTSGIDGERYIVNGQDCRGPRKTRFGLGRKACSGRLTTMIPVMQTAKKGK